MALTAYTLVTMYARQITTLALSSPVDIVNLGNKQSYTSGTGQYMVSTIYSYSGSLNASSVACFNLQNNSLKDNLGNTVRMTRFQSFLFFNQSTVSPGLCYLQSGLSLVRNFLVGVCKGTITTYGRSQLFMSAPMGNYSCGSVLKITAGSNTISYAFMIVA